MSCQLFWYYRVIKDWNNVTSDIVANSLNSFKLAVASYIDNYFYDLIQICFIFNVISYYKCS